MTLPSLRFLRSATAADDDINLIGARRGDVQWDRTVFKAPPLRIDPPVPDFGPSVAFDTGQVAQS